MGKDISTTGETPAKKIAIVGAGGVGKKMVAMAMAQVAARRNKSTEPNFKRPLSKESRGNSMGTLYYDEIPMSGDGSDD